MARKYVIRISIAIGLAVVVFVAVFMALVQFIPFDTAKLQSSTDPTVIYGNNGQVMLKIASAGESDLTYKQIPKDLQNALVATEDHNFWNSSSIDVRGILRAAFVDLWSGSLAQGGSTIQEQLAKIVYLNDKKTFSRKISQVVLGVQINRHFTKQQILTMYLNKVYLGEGATGVEQAAERYFGIDLRTHPQLTLAQAALLAGLPQAPSYYDPLQNQKAATTRRNEVLQNMVKYGYVSQAKASAAEKQPLGVSYHSLTNDPWASHPLLTNFLYDYLQNHMPNGDSITPDQLAQGGLKIYTTLDPNVQSAIQKVFWSSNYNGDFPGPTSGTVVQGAAVFVDPKTGGILGAAGSRKEGFTRFGYDRVYAKSSPGSSIKPIIDYAPAIQSGNWTPSSILDNAPQNFNGYKPANWSSSAPGKVTLEYGLTWSQNIASVWLLKQIGLQTGIQFAENDGITFTNKQKQHLCAAIGCEDVSPMQMAQAYEPFDDNGVQEQSHLVKKIVNQSGNVIFQYQSQSKQVMTQQTAQTMTQLMENVVQNGTGTRAQLSGGWGVAGKTGTVQYDPTQTMTNFNWVRNAWFDGYTPNIVGSIYIGYDQTDAKHHLSWTVEDPSANCAQIWHDIMQLAVQGQSPQQFTNVPPPQNQQQNNQSNAQGAVTNLQAHWDAGNQAVQLTWNTSLTSQPHFVVERAVVNQPAAQGDQGGTGQGGAGQLQPIGQVSATLFEDQTAQPGGTYTYVVQAVDPTSQSPIGQAQAVTVTVQGGPAGPPSGGGPGNITGGGPGTGTGDNNSTGGAPGGNTTGTGNGTSGGGTGSGGNGNTTPTTGSTGGNATGGSSPNGGGLLGGL